MSRIGNRILEIPTGVNVSVNDCLITITGPLGTLSREIPKVIEVEVNENTVSTKRIDEIKTTKQLHGTTNAHIKNMIEGVSVGFQKGLEIIGVGYRFTLKGNKLVINAGYSNPKELEIPEELKIESISNNEIVVKGIDKTLVGEFSANIRKIRKPEPYKGKGIRYKDEFVRRKEGKKASK